MHFTSKVIYDSSISSMILNNEENEYFLNILLKNKTEENNKKYDVSKDDDIINICKEIFEKYSAELNCYDF